MRRLVHTIVALALAGCSGAGGVVPRASTASRALSPQQAHAIPIALAPASAPCPARRTLVANCGARERDDIEPIADSPSLDPSSIPGYHPADLQRAYALHSDARGTTIAIVVPYGYEALESDLAVYRAKFGLPQCATANGCLRVMDMTSNPSPRDRASWSIETAIDVEIASAACPSCSLVVVEAQSDRLGDLMRAERAAYAQRPAVISNSWAIPEAAIAPTDQLQHQGVAVVAGSGDSGGVSWPASDPTVIAVGGTRLVPDDSTRGFHESGWTLAGFGCSAVFPKPAWQSGSCVTRGVADVSAVADPATPVAIYDSQPTGRGAWGNSGGWAVYGGTSVATPIVAAAIALAGNGPQLSTPQYLYDHSSSLNPVAPGLSPMQSGLGSPNGTVAF